MSAVSDLGWCDLALLAILGLSVIAGLWRGFVFEIVSLLGWVIAFVFANTLTPILNPLLPWSEESAGVRFWGTYVIIFVLVLILCGILARLMRALISATPLSILDRLLGGAFGVARGAVVLVIVAMLVTLSPFAHSSWWQQSQGALWLGQAIESLKPVLPQSVNVRINT
jgi:membrane protein required for colicin V production